MKSKLEARIDAKIGVEVYVYHFHDHTRREGGNPHRIWAFAGITIATIIRGRIPLENIVLEEQQACGLYPASDTLKGLHARGIYGVAGSLRKADCLNI